MEATTGSIVSRFMIIVKQSNISRVRYFEKILNMSENNLLKVVDIRVTKSDSGLVRDTGSATSLAGGVSNVSSDLFVKSSYDYADLNSVQSTTSRLSVNRSRSNASFATIGSSFSTSSLIRRCITADDVKISINEEQLNEFRSNVLNLFAQKQQVREFSKFSNCSCIKLDLNN